MEDQSQLSSRIVLERVRDTRPIRSFITKKILSWLEDHGITAAQQPVYRVALNRAAYGHFFTCQIQVHTQGSTWEALATEKDLHQAILSALNHMQPFPQRRTYALQPA